ncbi:MAG: CMP deaminase [Candidatus Yanofskybacteria bacterium]|nr:CMP deaminase [Candidatus Yanofskybacteria bacterium]
MSPRTEKWDRRFLALAEFIAQWSKDPSTKTGAVIVDPENRIVSVGYNGFPQGVADLPERLNNRELKYKLTVHCERNALIFAHESVKGCRLYTWPFMSCSPCASMMIQAGIIEAVAPFSDNPRWAEDFKLATEQFEEAGVKLKLFT